MTVKVDITKPPFTIGEGSPAEIGKQIADIYVGYEQEPPKPPSMWVAAAQAVKLQDPALFSAGLRLARVIERGEGAGIESGYHNTKHYVQVLLNATYLTLRNEESRDIVLTSREKGMLLFAALAHDFYYEPGGNKTPDGAPAPYRLEQIAFLKVKPYLEDLGVAQRDVDDIGVMIYGTDVSPASKAGAFVRAAHKYHFENGPQPAVIEVLNRVLPVLINRRLSRMAAMLGDADILSSAGLAPDIGNMETVKLRREWGKTTNQLEAADHTLGFFANIVENRFTTPEAGFFQSNLNDIKEAAQATKTRATLTASETTSENRGPR